MTKQSKASAWDGTCPETWPGKTMDEILDLLWEELLWNMVAGQVAGRPVSEETRQMAHGELRRRRRQRRASGQILTYGLGVWGARTPLTGRVWLPDWLIAGTAPTQQ